MHGQMKNEALESQLQCLREQVSEESLLASEADDEFAGAVGVFGDSWVKQEESFRVADAKAQQILDTDRDSAHAFRLALTTAERCMKRATKKSADAELAVVKAKAEQKILDSSLLKNIDKISGRNKAVFAAAAALEFPRTELVEAQTAALAMQTLFDESFVRFQGAQAAHLLTIKTQTNLDKWLIAIRAREGQLKAQFSVSELNTIDAQSSCCDKIIDQMHDDDAETSLLSSVQEKIAEPLIFREQLAITRAKLRLSQTAIQKAEDGVDVQALEKDIRLRGLGDKLQAKRS